MKHMNVNVQAEGENRGWVETEEETTYLLHKGRVAGLRVGHRFIVR